MKAAGKVEILKNIVVLSTNQRTGWSKELNQVKWTMDNGSIYIRYDIRDWNEDHSEYGKGIGLTEQEFMQLKTCCIQKTSLSIPSGIL